MSIHIDSNSTRSSPQSFCSKTLPKPIKAQDQGSFDAPCGHQSSRVPVSQLQYKSACRIATIFLFLLRKLLASACIPRQLPVHQRHLAIRSDAEKHKVWDLSNLHTMQRHQILWQACYQSTSRSAEKDIRGGAVVPCE